MRWGLAQNSDPPKSPAKFRPGLEVGVVLAILLLFLKMFLWPPGLRRTLSTERGCPSELLSRKRGPGGY